MKIIVSFSGGKDSLAALLYVRNNISKNFTTIFCDTGWESKITYDYIKKIDKQLNLNLITLKSKKYNGMADMARKVGRFPSTMVRFCTIELKSKPTIDYILDEVKDDFLIIQGIRAEESANRALMAKQCRFFKYYFEPHGYNKQGKPKYHLYRIRDIKIFCKEYADDLLRPIFKWSSKEVIDYIIKNGVKPNPLYYQGFKRVGCFPCIMCNHGAIKEIDKRYPERLDELSKMENEIGRNFFPPNYIPERYRSKTLIKKNGETIKYATTKDVRKYVSMRNVKLNSSEEKTSCMSFYGLCE